MKTAGAALGRFRSVRTRGSPLERLRSGRNHQRPQGTAAHHGTRPTRPTPEWTGGNRCNSCGQKGA
eukprot:14841011-Alexandrium_andersonii.AAC.1